MSAGLPYLSLCGECEETEIQEDDPVLAVDDLRPVYLCVRCEIGYILDLSCYEVIVAARAPKRCLECGGPLIAESSGGLES